MHPLRATVIKLTLRHSIDANSFQTLFCLKVDFGMPNSQLDARIKLCIHKATDGNEGNEGGWMLQMNRLGDCFSPIGAITKRQQLVAPKSVKSIRWPRPHPRRWLHSGCLFIAVLLSNCSSPACHCNWQPFQFIINNASADWYRSRPTVGEKAF